MLCTYDGAVKMYICSVLFSAVLLTNSVSSLNILGIYNYNGESHFVVSKKLLTELATKGHNVSVISHFPEENPKKNYHDINLAEDMTNIKDSVTILNVNFGRIMWSAYHLATTGINNCKLLLANKQVQELIKQKPKFDVILVEQFSSDCALGVAHKIGGPIVATTTSALLPSHNDKFGIPSNPAYTSFYFLGGGMHPTLLQRLERLFFEAYFGAVLWLIQKFEAYTLAKYFDDIPPLDDIRKEIKFLLLYQSFPLTGSRLLPANVKEVGGYHVEKPQTLKGDLKKFVEEAEHGVIYVSFGSLLNTSTFARGKLQALLETMAELPQRFIVKWNKSVIAGVHNKVYVDSWFPQIDILAHPNTVAFLSHGGMGSTVEAVHFGVPMVVMPLLGDQPSNAAAIEESGFGTQLPYSDFTKDNLMAAFKKVLDPEFRDKANEISAAWKDRPITALEEAVFWVEFAARHPTLSFRARAADVPFYHYLFLDIIGIFAVMLFIVCKIVKLFINKYGRIKKAKNVNISKKNQSKRE